MDASTRRSHLVDLLRAEGRVDVASAASALGTAEMTIRRDLDVLVDQGVARRVRGGAVNLMMRGDELPYAMRELEGADAKRRIAAEVAGLIADGEAVGLDSGTTVVHVARALSGRRLTALPLSLHAAMALAASPSIRLILPGGETRPGELAMAGPMAIAGIEALRLDTVVIGCCGVSPEGQVMAYDLGDAAVKQALFAGANRRILVADADKFGRSALAVVAPVADFDVLITDSATPAGKLAAFELAGVEVRRV